MQLYDIRGFKLPEEDICHHGIKGQKWGVRRYQNPDGSLTELGKKRYLRNGQLTEKGKKKLDVKKYDEHTREEERKKRMLSGRQASIKEKFPKTVFAYDGALAVHEGKDVSVTAFIDTNSYDEKTFLDICKNPTQYKETGVKSIRNLLETSDSAIREWWDDGETTVDDVINNLENPEIGVIGKDNYTVTFLSKEFGYHWVTTEIKNGKTVGELQLDG